MTVHLTAMQEDRLRQFQIESHSTSRERRFAKHAFATWHPVDDVPIAKVTRLQRNNSCEH